MEAKELMINDWVKIDEPDKYAGSYAQIKSLYHYRDGDGAYFDVFIFGEKGLLTTGVFCDDLRPVPITKKILKKNGFSHNEKWHNSFIDIDSYHIDVQFGYGGKIENVRIRELGKDTFIPSEKTNLYFSHIGYLHELQHAMKLCRIDKKFEL